MNKIELDKMTDEEKNIKIAELCGWSNIRIGVLFTVLCGTVPRKNKYCRKKWIPIPDYLNDLNAMYEAEQILENQKFYHYYAVLCQIVLDEEKGCHFASATARQRADAFLLTIV